ncbi:MAG: 4Fe-4S dicluster domain-containing protein [Spirosomataceae bacterium]
MKTYFQHISEGIRTTVGGMRLTLKHLWNARTRRNQHNIRESDYFNEQTGMVTLQYPFETMPIPDNGRYRLHNEMDDCIVCDKCAKVCPVDCIDIEPIKATAEVGKASDGSPIRLYAAKFDIDMAKCCYCGLCTTVCPTECLTMTKTFDYSEFDVRDMNYHYANLTPEQADAKKALYEQFLKEKEELKKSQQPAVGAGLASAQDAIAPQEPAEAKPKPSFRPTAKPVMPKPEAAQAAENTVPTKPKPVFAPKKPVAETGPQPESPPQAPVSGNEPTAKPKPVFRPAKPKEPAEELPAAPVVPVENVQESEIPEVPTPRPKPVFRPGKPKSATEEPQSVLPAEVKEAPEIKEAPAARPKPVFKPTMKPKAAEVPENKSEKEENAINNETGRELPSAIENTGLEEVKPRPKPIFKPAMKPKKEE